jgi:Xaa-Pro dipeptidase
MPEKTAAVGDAPSLSDVFDAALINPETLITALHLARTRKTAYEIACMSEASRLAAVAHRAAETAFRAGCSELEIHHAYLAACGHTDYRLPYNNIVALNEHGSVLHYQGREPTAPPDSRSFLIDAGCTVNAYCSDVTRTYTREEGLFADIVQSMNRLQQRLAGQVRAGVDFRDLHLETHQGISEILADADVITVPADDAVESGLSSVFYPHGLGHFIGLQTHDVAGLIDNHGKAVPRPDGHPFLRLTRILETDNVLTIEPGLYFIDPLLERWNREGDAAMVNWDAIESLKPFGGVRIEDNVVVEDTGCRNLTREAFEAA